MPGRISSSRRSSSEPRSCWRAGVDSRRWKCFRERRTRLLWEHCGTVFPSQERINTMGIEVVYRRLPESEFESILADPEKGRAFMTPSLPGFDLKALSALGRDPEALFAKKAEILAAFAKQREDPKRVDLQKDWQALH